MGRIVRVLAFALGFTIIAALASGNSTPRASVDAYGAPLAPGGSHPYIAAAPALAAARTALYFLNTRAYPDALPPNPSHTSFGRLMPDGTYCGVGCRTTDVNH